MLLISSIDQIVYDVLESCEADMLNLKQLYSNLETECKASKTVIPEEISQKMVHVQAEWAKVHTLSHDLKTALNTAATVQDGEFVKSSVSVSIEVTSLVA